MPSTYLLAYWDNPKTENLGVGGKRDLQLKNFLQYLRQESMNHEAQQVKMSASTTYARTYEARKNVGLVPYIGLNFIKNSFKDTTKPNCMTSLDGLHNCQTISD
jgi:hypothetical protein